MSTCALPNRIPQEDTLSREKLVRLDGRGAGARLQRSRVECARSQPLGAFHRGRTLPLRIASRLLANMSKASYASAILASAANHRPDAFLTVKGSYIAPDVLRQMRSQGIKTVMFSLIPTSIIQVDQRSFDEYDLFYTTKSSQMDYLRNLLGESRVRSRITATALSPPPAPGEAVGGRLHRRRCLCGATIRPTSRHGLSMSPAICRTVG